MFGFTVLLILRFLHAQLLQRNADDTDSGLWNLATTSLDADSSFFDDEEVALQNGIGLTDSSPLQPSSLVALDDDSPAMFMAESDPYTTSLDECSSPYGSYPSRRLRTRGALCTSDEIPSDETPQVNTNPFLLGLDASRTNLDPDNRRQCAYKFETLCCEGPVYGVYVADCVRCRFFFSYELLLPHVRFFGVQITIP